MHWLKWFRIRFLTVNLKKVLLKYEKNPCKITPNNPEIGQIILLKSMGKSIQLRLVKNKQVLSVRQLHHLPAVTDEIIFF